MVRQLGALLRRLASRRVTHMEKMNPVEIGALLRQVPGKWVAIKDGKLVDVQETPYKLFQSLKERDIRDATVIRAPGDDEAQLVGLG